MNTNVIETTQLCKYYSNLHALENVNVHVPKGAIYGLVGDNGAGKSTLLKILAGQSFATSGEIRLLGQTSERDLRLARKHIGCLIEDTGCFPNMTVAQTLRYYSIQRGISDKRRADEMLALVGLAEKRRAKCGSLSMGQRQRLGLAIAMLAKPQLLILDEPINGLDPAGIIEVRTLLQNLNEEENMTIVLSSHILAELEHIATHYGFLAHGKLVREISAESLHDQCADYIALIVSDTDEYAALFARTCPDEQLQVMPDGVLRIFAPRRPAAFYSKLATENGITILGMQTVQGSLEDYYMALRQEAGAR